MKYQEDCVRLSVDKVGEQRLSATTPISLTLASDTIPLSDE